MQSVTNLFIMNLALSDILMDLLAVPFTPIAYFQEEEEEMRILQRCDLKPFCRQGIGNPFFQMTYGFIKSCFDKLRDNRKNFQS